MAWPSRSFPGRDGYVFGVIIRPAPGSPLLITQPDHAALAARIMAQWRADELPESSRRADILLAVTEHDGGWLEIDHTPMRNDAGEILDFMTAPVEIRQGVWPRAVARLGHAPYAAALVAQHAIHVYARYRADDRWQAFFRDMELRRDAQLRAAAPATPEELLADYRFVRIGDLLSLTFCAGWTNAQTDPYGYVARLDDTRLTIEPDPFAGGQVALVVPARAVGDLRALTVTGVASGR